MKALKKILEKIMNKTNWEPFFDVMGVVVAALSIILPIVQAVVRQNGWWLLLWGATGPVYGVYRAVVVSFYTGCYR